LNGCGGERYRRGSGGCLGGEEEAVVVEDITEVVAVVVEDVTEVVAIVV
jgi:hypothetical protein